MNYAQIEAIGLKLATIEHEEIHASKEDRAKLSAQIEILWWVANLMGISDKVSDVRQKQTEISNKIFDAGKNSKIE